MTPSLGRVVLYTDMKGVEHAAQVERVDANDHVALTFNLGRGPDLVLLQGQWCQEATVVWMDHVACADPPEPHTWRWPPRVA